MTLDNKWISDSELSLTSKTQMFGFIEYFAFFYFIVYEQIFIFFLLSYVVRNVILGLFVLSWAVFISTSVFQVP